MSVPTYESVIAACKVGCFGCGAILDPERVRVRASAPHPPARWNSRSWSVECERCGDVLEFETADPRSSRPPTARVG